MTKNPLYNALSALAYIVLIVSGMTFAESYGKAYPEDNILMPIGMLSLFVLSAATMAFIFFYQPIMLFLDGKRAEAVRLFGLTVAIFAGITLTVLIGSMVLFR